MLTEKEIIDRALAAFYRKCDRECVAGNQPPSLGISYNDKTGVVNLGKGWPRYRWTGQRIVALSQ
jgi:hypothetical protein